MTKQLDIKRYSNFLPLDQLLKTFSQAIGQDEVFSIGKSKNNEEIFCGKIGKGKKTALVFGYPHPNEPVGSLACIELVRLIKENQDLSERYTWYIIPCIDPDGARLNEGWFKGKFSIKKYAENYYRQINNQTEWTFPVKYKKYKFDKPTKQTRALMNLIDKIKPSIVYPLHNSGFSGAYFLISKKLPVAFYKRIEQTAKRLHIPMHRGKFEVPFAKKLHPSFYQLFSVKEEYDFLEKIGEDPVKSIIGGASSSAYAKTVNRKVFSLVCEIPYIYDPAISDTRKTKITRIEAIQKQIKDNHLVKNFLESGLAIPNINKKSAFYNVTRENTNVLQSLLNSQQAVQKTLGPDKVSKAELLSAEVVAPFYRTLMIGELRRLLLDSKQTARTKKSIKECDELISQRIKIIKRKSNYRIVPISSLVEFQIRYLLEALKHL